jgi:HEAT repeat protein
MASDINELADRRWWRRVKAIERLEDTGLLRAEDEILARLSDRSREVRFTALRNLALSKSKKIHGKIAGIFSASSTWSYLYLVNILYQANLPLKILDGLAKSDNPFQRKAAATLLGASSYPKAVGILAELAEDASPEVRREAVFSLARIGSTAAIPVFWRRVADESPQVRAAIAKGIGDIGHLVLLQELVDDDAFEVRFQAFASLSRLGMVGKEVIKNYQGKYSDLAREFLVEVNYA